MPPGEDGAGAPPDVYGRFSDRAAVEGFDGVALAVHDGHGPDAVERHREFGAAAEAAHPAAASSSPPPARPRPPRGPKASVIDRHGHLSTAKFPKETDDCSAETWEEIAQRLAGRRAGIATPAHSLIDVAGKKVMLSRRFDRDGQIRIPFLSAMAMTGARDGERSSYPEIVDALSERGSRAKTEAHALYRRFVFNVLIANVDDHLRNHGFLRLGKTGWSLFPACDLNPAPADLGERAAYRL